MGLLGLFLLHGFYEDILVPSDERKGRSSGNREGVMIRTKSGGFRLLDCPYRFRAGRNKLLIFLVDDRTGRSFFRTADSQCLVFLYTQAVLGTDELVRKHPGIGPGWRIFHKLRV